MLKPGESCKNCRPVKKTTNENGYDYKHKKASERHRTNYPLCERCMMVVGVVGSNPSEHMHHIIAITESENMRMNTSNWLAVCSACHDLLEGDSMAGFEVRKWSDLHYVDTLNEGLG